jgi:predicted naringenin-chalcone synthase
MYSMARILSTATAVPPHRVSRELYQQYCAVLYGDKARAARRIADNACIDARYITLAPEELLALRGLEAKSRAYDEAALRLSEEVARRALDRADLDATDVDQIITTSCTGVMIPSVDAYLVERMKLRRDVVRLPITELGCAAGAAAVARAREHQLAFPGRVSLIIACELSSLTLQPGDQSMTNLVAASIFGDGCAATLLGPRERSRRPSPTVIDSVTHLFPESHYLMGFELKDGGFHIVLDRDVPNYLRGKVRPLVEALLDKHGVGLGDVRFTALHPGGRRILEDLDRDLEIGGLTEPSWDVLRRYGNLSSATVLFVLDEVMRRAAPPLGSYGLLAAFGPGFTAEISLLRWEA